MELLFDPPPRYEIPLSYGSDLRLVFKNKVPGSDPAEYQDFPAGTTGVFAIGKPSAVVASVAAVIDGSVAIIKVESEVVDAVRAGAVWRFVISNNGVDITAVNGKMVRSDGS